MNDSAQSMNPGDVCTALGHVEGLQGCVSSSVAQGYLVELFFRPMVESDRCCYGPYSCEIYPYPKSTILVSNIKIQEHSFSSIALPLRFFFRRPNIHALHFFQLLHPFLSFKRSPPPLPLRPTPVARATFSSPERTRGAPPYAVACTG